MMTINLLEHIREVGAAATTLHQLGYRWRGGAVWERVENAQNLAQRERDLTRHASDSAILDWLEARGCAQFLRYDNQPPNRRWFDCDTPGSDHHPTLRAAVIGAMLVEQQQKEGAA